MITFTTWFHAILEWHKIEEIVLLDGYTYTDDSTSVNPDPPTDIEKSNTRQWYSMGSFEHDIEISGRPQWPGVCTYSGTEMSSEIATRNEQWPILVSPKSTVPSRVYRQGLSALFPPVSDCLFSAVPVQNRRNTWYRYFCQVSDFRLPFRCARQWDANLRVSVREPRTLVFEKLFFFFCDRERKEKRVSGRRGCVLVNRDTFLLTDDRSLTFFFLFFFLSFSFFFFFFSFATGGKYFNLILLDESNVSLEENSSLKCKTKTCRFLWDGGECYAVFWSDEIVIGNVRWWDLRRDSSSFQICIWTRIGAQNSKTLNFRN